jgi:cytochrome c biogenesis protein CcmG/thiol:disulfide interchange protein DsbE
MTESIFILLALLGGTIRGQIAQPKNGTLSPRTHPRNDSSDLLAADSSERLSYKAPRCRHARFAKSARPKAAKERVIVQVPSICKVAVLACIVSFSTMPVNAADPNPLVATVGKPAPAFVLEDLSGAPLYAKTLRGKPLFINVFATWCPPCRIELPNIVRSYARFRTKVTFLGVDEQEPAGTIAPFTRTMGIHYTVAIDQGQMEASYRAHSVPTSVFIDRRGIVRALYRGPIPADVLQKYLQLIAGS